MKKYKNKIIISAVILAVLIGAFALGNNAATVPTPDTNAKKDIIFEQIAETANEKQSQIVEEAPVKKKDEAIVEVVKEKIVKEETSSEQKKEGIHGEKQGIKPDKSTAKDKYQTDPTPKDKPVPLEPQSAIIKNTELTCTLSVRCDTILNNISLLDQEKIELVPIDGIVYAEQTVIFYEGESIFNVLLREMKKNKIHFEFVNTPIYNSAYVEGIANLYEFDCGELSGWVYKVNDWSPNYGCSRYSVKDGDKIEWIYTCDLGADVGASNSLIGGR